MTASRSESVHRLSATLQALANAFGAGRLAVLTRELTKLHEEAYRGSLGELCARVGGIIPLKGEFTVLVAGTGQEPRSDEAEAERIYRLLVEQVPASSAVELTAAITGLSRNAVYRLTRV